jgi:hypothetical protein
MTAAISSLMDEVFEGYTVFDVLRYVDRTAPIISEDDAVIKAIVVLKALEPAAILVVNKRGEAVGVLGIYGVFTLLHEVGSTSPEKLWAALYRTPAYDVDWLNLPLKQLCLLRTWWLE